MDAKELRNRTKQFAHRCAKLSIFLKEANESMFWMQCLTDEHLFEKHLVSPLLVEARESTAVFVAARKTAKNRTGEFEDDCKTENNNQ